MLRPIATKFPHGLLLAVCFLILGTVGWGQTVTGGTNGIIGEGNNAAFAVKFDESRIWGWGGNSAGQLGIGSFESQTNPTLLLAGTSGLLFSGSAPNVISVKGGADHSMFLMNDGSVYVSGANDVGQLGNSGTISSFSPYPLPTLVFSSTGTQIAKIASGSSHLLAVDTHGLVWAWGGNASGQVGNGTVANQFTPTMVLVGTVPLARVTDAAGGEKHSLAIAGTNAAVYAWGDDTYGQLGLNASGTIPITRARPVVSSSAFLLNAVGLAAGGKFSMAVLQDGSVWSWGSESNGELGNGSLTLGRNHAGQVLVSGTGTTGVPLQNIAALAAGEMHSLALTGSGTVLAWGANTYGQLGIGSTTSQIYPQTVVTGSDNAPLSNVVQIAAGLDFSMALTSDGKIYVWGANSSGQLGSGVSSGQSNYATLSGTLLQIADIPPSVSLSITGETIAPATLTLTGSATDPDDGLASLSFLQGGLPYSGGVATSPYSLSVTNLLAGTYYFSAQAIDKHGLTSTSTTSAVTIVPPTVSGSVSVSAITETGGVFGDIRIIRNGPTFYPLPVNYTVDTTGSNAATPGTDYVALSGSLMIAPGASFGDIYIQPLQDVATEPDETVTVNLASGDGYTVGTTTPLVVTLQDSETVGVSKIQDAGYLNGVVISGTFHFMRGGPLDADLAVTYISWGTALSGTDYSPALSGTVVIPAGLSYADVTVGSLLTGTSGAVLSQAAKTLSVAIVSGSSYQVAPRLSFATMKISGPLELWWRFDEGTGSSVADSAWNGDMGVGNTGVIYSGSGENPWGTGINSTHDIKFDGNIANQAVSNVSWVTTSSANSLTAGEPFTFGFWLKPNFMSSGTTVPLAINGFEMSITRGTHSQTLHFSGSNFDLSASVTPNAWHYVTAVSDGTTSRLYVSGSLVSTGSAGALTGPALTLGALPGVKSFNGEMDDVRLYNCVLSGSQIAALASTSSVVTGSSGTINTAAATDAMSITLSAPAFVKMGDSFTVSGNATSGDGYPIQLVQLSRTDVGFIHSFPYYSSATTEPFFEIYSKSSQGVFTFYANGQTTKLSKGLSNYVTVTVLGYPYFYFTPPANNSYFITGPSVPLGGILNIYTAVNNTLHLTGTMDDPEGASAVTLSDEYSTQSGGSASVSSMGSSSFSFDYTPATTGTHYLIAEAHNTFNESYSSYVNIIAVTRPAVSIIQPTDGLNVVSGSAIQLSAATVVGTKPIASVSYFINGTNVGTSSVAPYNVTAIVSGTGSHSLYAVVTDSVGVTGTSTPTIHVDGFIVPVPTVGVQTITNASFLDDTLDTPGVVRFTATPLLSRDISVKYTVTQAPYDGGVLTTLSGSAVIPAGQTYVDVPVPPLLAYPIMEPITVTMASDSTGSYAVDPANASAVVSLGGSTLQSPLILWWKFNEDEGSGEIVDSSPDGYYSTVLYSDYPDDSSIRGTSFNGTGDILFNGAVANSDFSNITNIGGWWGLDLWQGDPFTASMWINVQADPNLSSRVLARGLVNLDVDYGSGGYGVHLLGFNNDGSSFDTSAPIMPATWYHVAVVYDGTTCGLYINGRLISSHVGYPFNEYAYLNLGEEEGRNSLEGAIEDVRVYSVALSLSQVSQIASAGGNSIVPAVAISSSTSAIQTNGITPAVFTVGRSYFGPNPGGALTVPYSISGSAANGRDYPWLSGKVTIPAGASSVNISVVPYTGASTSKTLTLTLNSPTTASYQINGATNSASVSLNPTTATAPQLAVLSGTLTTVANTATTGNFGVQSNSGDNWLIFRIVNQPAHGEVVISGSSFIYRSSLTTAGSDSFTYVADNNLMESNTATISVVILSSNSVPVAQNANYSVAMNGQLIGNLTASDVSQSALAYTIIDKPSNGTVTLNGLGFTYQPNAEYSGPDAFSFVASNAFGSSTKAVVSINVLYPLTNTSAGVPPPGYPMAIQILNGPDKRVLVWSSSDQMYESAPGVADGYFLGFDFYDTNGQPVWLLYLPFSNGSYQEADFYWDGGSDIGALSPYGWGVSSVAYPNATFRGAVQIQAVRIFNGPDQRVLTWNPSDQAYESSQGASDGFQLSFDYYDENARPLWMLTIPTENGSQSSDFHWDGKRGDGTDGVWYGDVEYPDAGFASISSVRVLNGPTDQVLTWDSINQAYQPAIPTSDGWGYYLEPNGYDLSGVPLWLLTVLTGNWDYQQADFYWNSDGGLAVMDQYGWWGDLEYPDATFQETVSGTPPGYPQAVWVVNGPGVMKLVWNENTIRYETAPSSVIGQSSLSLNGANPTSGKPDWLFHLCYRSGSSNYSQEASFAWMGTSDPIIDSSWVDSNGVSFPDATFVKVVPGPPPGFPATVAVGAGVSSAPLRILRWSDANGGYIFSQEGQWSYLSPDGGTGLWIYSGNNCSSSVDFAWSGTSGVATQDNITGTQPTVTFTIFAYTPPNASIYELFDNYRYVYATNGYGNYVEMDDMCGGNVGGQYYEQSITGPIGPFENDIDGIASYMVLGSLGRLYGSANWHISEINGAPYTTGTVDASAGSLIWEDFPILPSVPKNGPPAPNTHASQLVGGSVPSGASAITSGVTASQINAWATLTTAAINFQQIDPWVTGTSGGVRVHQSVAVWSGYHKHGFNGISAPIQTGDHFEVDVYIDPSFASQPKELMVSFKDSSGSEDHRAYWGTTDLFGSGTNGTPSCHKEANLPATGGWVRLSIPASDVGLEGKTVSGVTFAIDNGNVTWAQTGRISTATTGATSGDSNNDGIPDWWEMQYFGTLSVNMSLDTDGDGYTNLQEYLLGTDPTVYSVPGNSPALNLQVYTVLK